MNGVFMIFGLFLLASCVLLEKAIREYERKEDEELAGLVKSRKGQKRIKVKLDDI